MLILFYILLFPVRFGGDGVPTAHPYDPTPGERSVLLQCPVLSDSENPTSLDDLNSRAAVAPDLQKRRCVSAAVFTRSKAQPDRGDGVPTAHPYDPTPGERSVLLQCPVLSDSENPTSLDDLNSRCCGSRSVGPFFSFHCRNNVEVDENNLNRSRNSVFSNICSSGDLCCSVGKCEQTWGNCSEPEIEGKG
ncbi:hypothetical protein D4764_0116880 [Takifugu flavidus]|uniref:Uncharacterized protein n=1 Tax=Takifugu flavidus TaxID=433684 RepID=A0A5C6MFY0_9TELE|nr:hypothetical protein D4764_0116880 [Takifugu flavidus]